MTPVAPFVVNGAVALSGDEYADAAKHLTERLLTLPDADPIPFRHQNGGDYDSHLVLRDEHAPGETGVGIHRTDDGHCDSTGGDTEAPR
jgi:NAD(P)H dehydrogenase (quinone)